MTTQRTIPDWCKPGAEVLILADGGRRGTELAAIERVTATQVIVNGRRFRVDRSGVPGCQPNGSHSTMYSLERHATNDTPPA
jgi:hypothetical protein